MPTQILKGENPKKILKSLLNSISEKAFKLCLEMEYDVLKKEEVQKQVRDLLVFMELANENSLRLKS